MTPFLPASWRRRRGPAVSGGDLRIVIIGAGKFASRTYYPLLRSMQGVSLVAACARTPSRLAPLARRHRVPATYTDLPEMLERERPDAAFAVVPPASALPVAREVLSRAIPLYIEKPPGLSAVETREMAALALERGVASMVAFNRRYCAVIREAKARIAGAGGIQSVIVEFHKDRPAGGAGDDLVTDIIHIVDLLRGLGGEVGELASVCGAQASSGRASPAYHALLRFESGATGLLAAFRSGGSRRERVEIHGPGISAEIDPPDRALLHRAKIDKPEILTGRALTGSADVLDTYGFADEARIFLEAVRGGPAPATDLADAVKTMELVERIREEARSRVLSLAPATVTSRPAAAPPAIAPPPAGEARDGRASPAGAPPGAGKRPLVAVLLTPEIATLVFPAPVREQLMEFADILPTGEGMDRKIAARALEQAEGVITSWKSPRLTAPMALRAPRLRIIAHAAGSVKTFVDGVFFERGVAVTNAAVAISPSVGEMALAMTLAGLRSLIRYDREVRRGDFRKSYTAAPADSRGLYGRRVGLIGFGRTARDFIRLLQPFGCEILAFDPHAEPSTLAAAGARPATLEEVLRTSDVVSLHAAYTPETHHLLNAERLAMLKDGALLVNTARGALLDETALAAQLRTGRIAAGLDVTVVEPLPSGAELTALPNVILTPHIGGPTHERLPALGRSAVEDLRIFFAGGRPPNLITPQMLATMA